MQEPRQDQYHHGDLRAAILDAAEAALVDATLESVSMRELARRAGVSSGAPYHHFGDRSGLLVALCQRGFTRLGEVLERAHKRGGLEGMTKAYMKFSKDYSVIYQLMFSKEATAGEGEALLHDHAAPVFDLLVGVLQESMPGADEEEAVLTAISVWYFMHGVASLSYAPPLLARLGKHSLTEFAYSSVMKLVQGKSKEQ